MDTGNEHYEAVPETPPVWKWYVAYCIAMALLYAMVAALGVILMILPPETFAGKDPAALKIQAIVCILIGLPFILIYAIAPFLPKKPWAWIYGIVMIAISLTSCCCLPAGIPLLIFWIKPETQRFFGRG
jgi:hypothetical protein